MSLTKGNIASLFWFTLCCMCARLARILFGVVELCTESCVISYFCKRSCSVTMYLRVFSFVVFAEKRA